MTIALTQRIESKLAEKAILEVISRFEAAFPAATISYYVEGSHADGSAIPTSDLDLIIVFGSMMNEAEESKANQLMTQLESDSPIELDIELAEQSQLRQSANPMFKLGSVLIYGEEIRETIPLMPIDLWARERMHAAYWLLINVFERPKPVRAPLDFPKPEALYLGYVNRPMQLGDGSKVMTTRNLIRVTGWMTTARIAYEAKKYVVRKRECYSTYKQAIGDEWTELLGRIDQRCRTEWHYRIPANVAEQQELRSILEQVLDYENHFLAVYRRFLLQALASSDAEAIMSALRFLRQVPFADANVIQAVRLLGESQDDDVRALAQEAYRAFGKS